MEENNLQEQNKKLTKKQIKLRIGHIRSLYAMRKERKHLNC